MDEQASTPDRILDAAERLFAEHGIAAVSLRKIIGAAGVNIAAVHYHFGSKEELVRAVFRRRLSHVNEQRLHSLSALKEKYGDQVIPLDDLLEVFFDPVLTLSKDHSGGSNFIRVAARAHADPDPVVRNELYSQLRSVVQLFLAEIKRTLPHLSEDELKLRFSFMAGAMVQVVLMPYKDFFNQQISDASLERKQLLKMLVRFCRGGLEAGEVL